MEIHLIRHSPPDIGKGICYGQLDVDVNHLYHQYANAYTEKLPKEFDVVYSSPLKRCKLLALNFDVNYVEDKNLMELNFGSWEGKGWQEIPASEIAPWYVDYVNTAPTNGESYHMMFERVRDFMKTLETMEHKKILLVTHAGVLRSVLAYVLEIQLKKTFQIAVDFGVHIRLHYSKEMGWRLDEISNVEK